MLLATDADSVRAVLNKRYSTTDALQFQLDRIPTTVTVHAVRVCSEKNWADIASRPLRFDVPPAEIAHRWTSTANVLTRACLDEGVPRWREKALPQTAREGRLKRSRTE